MPGNKFKIDVSLSGVLDTTQFAFWPAMGMDDLETMARESLKEALERHLADLKMKLI